MKRHVLSLLLILLLPALVQAQVRSYEFDGGLMPINELEFTLLEYDQSERDKIENQVREVYEELKSSLKGKLTLPQVNIKVDLYRHQPARIIGGSGTPVLRINTYFVHRARKKFSLNNQKWALKALMIHELAHLVKKHTEKYSRSNKTIELEADRFTGKWLYKLGATSAQAQLAVGMLLDKASATHPSKADRLKAIADGWNSAMNTAYLLRSFSDQSSTTNTGSTFNWPSTTNTRSNIDWTSYLNTLSTSRPTASVAGTRVETNVTVGSQLGMRIYTDFSVQHMQGKKVQVAAYFYYRDGRALKDKNGSYSYKTATGDVAVSRMSTVQRDNSRFDDFSLFMPYDELDLGTGRYELQMKVKIWDMSGSTPKRLAESSWTCMTYNSTCSCH